MQIEQLVDNAHRRLQLRRLLVAIERNPQLLEDADMTHIKGPIELAGMAARLRRAEKTEIDVGVTGKRYDEVLDRIDDKHGALKGHVGSLEAVDAQLGQVIDRMVDRSNGSPNDGGESLTVSNSEVGDVGQVIESKPV